MAAASPRDGGRERPWSLPHSLGLAAGVLALCAWLYEREPLAPVDRSLLDLGLTLVVADRSSEPVVVVAIDDDSLAEVGRWPWPRALQAELIERLGEAAALGYDIGLTERSERAPSGDARLAATIAGHGRVVLPLLATRTASGLEEIPPLPAFAEAAAGIGHGLVTPDPDGVVRRLPLWAGAVEPLFPAFALETLAVARPARRGDRPPATPVEAVDGWYRAGVRLIPFGALDAPELISAADVLAGRVGARVWRDRVVVVGVTAEGLAPRVQVAAGVRVRALPGSAAQARAIRALAAGAVGEALAPPVTTAAGTTAAAIVGGLFVANRRSLVLAAAALLLPVPAALTLLVVGELWIPPSGALLAAGLFIALREFGRRRQARRQLRLERRRAATMLETIDTGVVVVDGAERIRFANGAAERLLGRARGELEGGPLGGFVNVASSTEAGLDDAAIAAGGAERPAAAGVGAAPRLVHVRTPAGELRVAQLSRAVTLPDPRGDRTELVAMTDVTELVRTKRELERLATHDLTTALPNRQFVKRHLDRSIARAKRTGTDLAVLLIDLDHFKEVNDRFGHQVGDALLRAVAVRLAEVCRGNDLVARFGGDEFVVVMEDLRERRYAALLADKLLAAFRSPVEAEGRTLHVELSIGVSCLGDQPGDGDALLSRADTAMYAAKHRRGAFRLFSPELDAAARRELELREELRASVASRGFELHFQPRVELGTARITGFEALLRWRRRDGTPVSPAVFVPVAENAGLIEVITEWVIEEALRVLRRWRAASPRPLTISVNVSARHFLDPRLALTIENALAAAALPPAALVVEITESMLMRDPGKAIEVMRVLKTMGVNIAIDDFGTGYSSLAYLRDFPIDEIKIDKSFAARIGVDERDDLIVTAIARMAQSLRIETVAEGVEYPQQAAFLRRLAVRQAQGFLFSRPVPAETADALVASGHAPPRR